MFFLNCLNRNVESLLVFSRWKFLNFFSFRYPISSLSTSLLELGSVIVQIFVTCDMTRTVLARTCTTFSRWVTLSMSVQGEFHMTTSAAENNCFFTSAFLNHSCKGAKKYGIDTCLGQSILLVTVLFDYSTHVTILFSSIRKLRCTFSRCIPCQSIQCSNRAHFAGLL